MQRRFSSAFFARPLALSLLVASVGLPVLSPPSAAIADTTWNVQVGFASNNQAVQAEVFLPSVISINVGDTVHWSVKSGEPHTVTFLSGNPPISPFAPPTGDSTLDRSNDDEIFHSGLLEEDDTYDLTFGSQGTFNYLCLLHPGMDGQIRVAAADSKYPHIQKYYDRQAKRESQTLKRQGNHFLKVDPLRGPGQVNAGVGDGIIDIMRFQPDPITIHVGSTVTWTNRGTGAPHTVTFGEEPGNPAATVGLSGEGEAVFDDADDDVSSGFIGADPEWNGSTFRVTFNLAGRFDYICALHDELGMVGTVIVEP